MKSSLKRLCKSFIPILFLAFLLVGCSPDKKIGRAEGEKIQVVATTTMIADLIEVIGGDKVEVNGLMGPGIDPHGYNATASDVTSMIEADIVAYNGMHLEGQMGAVFGELSRVEKDVIVLEDVVPESAMLETDEEEMPIDPHIWFSVPLWKKAAQHVADSLSEYDPDNDGYYQENNHRYQQELEELDNYIRQRAAEVPAASRYLVTAHDAFSYFGDEYGFEVVGLQGLNTQAEAGTRDVSHLAQFIVDHKIKAVFIETSVPTKTIESLQEAVRQRGWEVEIGGELFSDALGDKKQNAETFIKMYRYNIDTIVDSLK